MENFIIKKITNSKTKTTIIFTNDDSIVIDRETFLLSPLHEGDELSLNKLKEILFINEQNEAFKYCIKLLSKYHYSESRLKEKLNAKGFSEETIDAIIEKLKNYDLVNDLEYAFDIYNWAIENRYGKLKFLKKVQDLDLKFELTDDFNFEYERNTVNELVEELKIKFAKEKPNDMKAKIYRNLLNRGFASEIIMDYLGTIE